MITLRLPIPPSVNRSRKVNWAYKKKVDAWKASADALVMQTRQHRQTPILGQFHASIVIDERRCRADADNVLKALFDYCKRLGLISDDSPKYMRGFSVIWGNVPEGIQITIEAVEKEKAAL